MNYEGLLGRIAEFDDLAMHANDKSIREKCAELAETYRELARATQDRELAARKVRRSIG